MSDIRVTRRELLALSAVTAALSASPAAAQILGRRRLRLIPREAHPWARFMHGAWRTVSTETLVFNTEGKVLERTTSESITEFVNNDNSNCHLKVETCTQIPGSEVTSLPRKVILPIDPEGDNEVKKLEDAVVNVAGKKRRVEVLQAKLTEKTGDKVMTVHLTNDSAPHILKRETKVLDTKSNEPVAITRTEVVKLDVTRPVAGENRKTWEVRTVHEHPAGKVETTEYLCDEVPGEVVYQKSEEFDPNGRLIRRSTVELMDFGKDNIGRRPLLGRRERVKERRSL